MLLHTATYFFVNVRLSCTSSSFIIKPYNPREGDTGPDIPEMLPYWFYQHTDGEKTADKCHYSVSFCLSHAWLTQEMSLPFISNAQILIDRRSRSLLQFNFVGKLLGPRGNSLKRLQEDTLTKMSILGKGSMRDKEKVTHRSVISFFSLLSVLLSLFFPPPHHLMSACSRK